MACQYAHRASTLFRMNEPTLELEDAQPLGVLPPAARGQHCPVQPVHSHRPQHSQRSQHPQQKRAKVAMTRAGHIINNINDNEADLAPGKGVDSVDNHEDKETMALKCIALFAKWVRSLRQAHCNCLNIPVTLVIKMGIRMVHHLVLKRGLRMKKETLATTFWVALKFYSSRDTIPNASFMSMVTEVPKKALLGNEPKVLTHLGWDLYAFYTDE